jgi:hypothetical protein
MRGGEERGDGAIRSNGCSRGRDERPKVERAVKARGRVSFERAFLDAHTTTSERNEEPYKYKNSTKDLYHAIPTFPNVVVVK